MTSHQVIKKGSELTVIAASPRPEGPAEGEDRNTFGIHEDFEAQSHSHKRDPWDERYIYRSMNFVDFYEVNLGKHIYHNIPWILWMMIF